MARYPLIERVLHRTRDILRVREYSPRTEEVYLGWIDRFLRFHGSVHPMALERGHVEAFLEDLALRARLAPKSRNQAASALSFLFREVLGREEVADVPRAKGGSRVPVVLSRRETRAVLAELRGRYRLIGALLYGTGMRLNECLGLRLKDLDYKLAQIIVRDGKGMKDRYVLFPDNVHEHVRRQARRVAEQHRADRERGGGWAPLPGALHRKDPEAGWEIAWQFLFPAARPSADPATGRQGRNHLHESAMQRAMKQAVRRSGILKHATCHTLRHSFASQLLRDGCDIRRVKELLGHKDIRTTMIYLHAIDQTGIGIRSPLDRPEFGRELTDPFADD